MFLSWNLAALNACGMIVNYTIQMSPVRPLIANCNIYFQPRPFRELVRERMRGPLKTHISLLVPNPNIPTRGR